MTYNLAGGLRRLGLPENELAEAQVSTMGTKLLTVGARIRVSMGKFGASYPWEGPLSTDLNRV